MSHEHCTDWTVGTCFPVIVSCSSRNDFSSSVYPTRTVCSLVICPEDPPVPVSMHMHCVSAYLALTSQINKLNKPVGDWISVPSPNFVAMATRIGSTTFCMVPLNRPSLKTPGRPKHLRSICYTSRLIGNFVQILWSKFWVLEDHNQQEPCCRRETAWSRVNFNM